jgi:thioredoxin-like negative regulator of GroEL
MPESNWASAGIEILTTKDFPNGQLDRPGPYVVCFGAAWCSPTRRFMPKFVALQDKLPAKVAIADITDREDRLWDVFRIRITPSIIVFRDGAVQMRVDGRRFVGLTDSDLAKLKGARI